jgi:hypothetical protein
LLIGLAVMAIPTPVVRAADRFAIAGEVDGLYPGATATLDARLTNPYPFAIRVISATATAQDASVACPASMLVIGDAQAEVEIPARASGSVPLAVRMVRSAPDACQGAIWPLEFTGTAVGPDTTELPGTSMLHPRNLPVLLAIGAALIGAGLVALGRRHHRARRIA